MMVRFLSQLPDLHFPENVEPTHPDYGSILVVKSVSNQVLEKIHQLAHQTHDQQMQKQDSGWMTSEWKCFARSDNGARSKQRYRRRCLGFLINRRCSKCIDGDQLVSVRHPDNTDLSCRGMHRSTPLLNGLGHDDTCRSQPKP